jgi:hypothetical protein
MHTSSHLRSRMCSAFFHIFPQRLIISTTFIKGRNISLHFNCTILKQLFNYQFLLLPFKGNRIDCLEFFIFIHQLYGLIYSQELHKELLLNIQFERYCKLTTFKQTL